MTVVNKLAIKVLALGVAVSVSTQSCTDLTEPEYDVIAAENFLKNDAQVAAALGPAYGGLRGITDNWFNPSEATTDELIVPTRGGDWYDNGDWLAYSRHTWTAFHGPINGVWGYIFSGVSTANQLLANSVVSANPTAKAELRGIRAFYYFMAIDTFGNVPISLEGGGDAGTKSRTEVYAFIESELNAILPNLLSGKVYSRFTQDVANMLLAKLYINAGVYKGVPEWQKALDAANKVINSANTYSLAPTTLSNFATQNTKSDESIWNIPYDSFLAGGMNFQMRTLHYANSRTFDLSQSPWNGFCTLADFYNSFEDGDARKDMWLEGQQYSAAGEVLLDAKDQPLAYQADFEKDQMTDADPEFQRAGVRSQKYEIQRSNPNANQDNDFVVFRLADAVMLKSEALFRLGRTAEALVELNKVRTRSGVAPFTTITADIILAERGREFAWEGWRRNDMIRFGVFNKERKFMKNTDPNKNLFPIPQPRIDSNPLLKQNPGY